MKKWLKIIGCVIIFFAVVLFAAGQYFYGQGVKRGTEVKLHEEDMAVNATASMEDQQLLAKALEWYDEQKPKVLEMVSYDGLKLKAKWIEQKEKTGKAVILAHGFRNTSDDMGKLARFYYEQGFDILLPDARGHGDSEGEYIGYGWHERLDYVDWIEQLITERGATDIILHGNSMGAATVLMTSGEKLPNEVKGIIADSGYTSVGEELQHQLKNIYHLPSFPLLNITSVITKYRAGFTFEEASAIEQVKKNTRPLLIIHGDADDLVPTQMGKDLYKAAGGEKELWIVPNAGHTKAYDNIPSIYQEKLKTFIQQVLGE